MKSRVGSKQKPSEIILFHSETKSGHTPYCNWPRGIGLCNCPDMRIGSNAASEMGRKRMAKLTPKEKTALGKLGAAKRWAKERT